MSDPTPRALLEVALAAADAASAVALRWFLDPPRAEAKADGTPVTIADREAERAIRAVILRAFPDHAILGEEDGESGGGGAHHRWIVDPIDGTKSFVRGVPLWGTLVAVERDGEPIAGVCRMPALGETVAAARGEGCTWNDWPCRVSDVADLRAAALVTTSARAVRRGAARFNELEDAVALARGWSDCWAFCLVATGRADLAVDIGLKRWDAAAFLPILEEAGGRLTDWCGRRAWTGPDVVASNGGVHDAALSYLQDRP